MILGVDYYPEHWPVHMIDDDIKTIKAMGANTVRIGEFAWHMMEREEGLYDFSYFDGVIDKLKAAGLSIIFGTPTATFPAWLSHRYEVLSQDEYGNKRVFGGRRQYCYNSPDYNAKAEALVKALLSHYQDEEGIIAWQIDNELGHEGSDMCYCETCHKGFQNYLKKRYTNIETLNETYGTIFWGQTYNDFDEIPLPKPTITTHNPALRLDWARFRSESINGFAKRQIEIVNAYKMSHQKVIHNLFGGFFDRAYDQNYLAKELDVVAYDNYPVWGGLVEPLKPAHIAMTHDYIRGLKNQNFWIVEELMGAQGHNIIGYLPRPNQCKLWSHQAMAHGCEALLYFRYRGMTHGAEQFCQGILDADNAINAKFMEVQSFFDDVKPHEDLLKMQIEADVLVAYDYDNTWSWKIQQQSEAFDYTRELVRFYEGFYSHNVLMDVRSIKADFMAYKVVVLPLMQIIDGDLLKRLETYVRSGGILITGYRAGIKNADNNIHFGPSPLQTLAGIKVENYESLEAGKTYDILASTSDQTLPQSGSVSVWRDMIKVIDAKVLSTYTDDFYKEYAAVTVKTLDKGCIYYVGGGLDATTMSNLSKKVAGDAGINRIASPEGVEVIDRGSHHIIMNHLGVSQNYDGLNLAPYEVYYLKKEKTGN